MNIPIYYLNKDITNSSVFKNLYTMTRTGCHKQYYNKIITIQKYVEQRSPIKVFIDHTILQNLIYTTEYKKEILCLQTTDTMLNKAILKKFNRGSNSNQDNEKVILNYNEQLHQYHQSEYLQNQYMHTDLHDHSQPLSSINKNLDLRSYQNAMYVKYQTIYFNHSNIMGALGMTFGIITGVYNIPANKYEFDGDAQEYKAIHYIYPIKHALLLGMIGEVIENSYEYHTHYFDEVM